MQRGKCGNDEKGVETGGEQGRGGGDGGNHTGKRDATAAIAPCVKRMRMLLRAEARRRKRTSVDESPT